MNFEDPGRDLATQGIIGPTGPGGTGNIVATGNPLLGATNTIETTSLKLNAGRPPHNQGVTGPQGFGPNSNDDK